jgi:hypothetical protein
VSAGGAAAAACSLADLVWQNRHLAELPTLPELRRGGSGPTVGVAFAMAAPEPLDEPELLLVSPAALARVRLALPAGAPAAASGIGQRAAGAEAEATARLARQLGGAEPFWGARPVAHCYCGTRLLANSRSRGFSGQLGDGAAVLLGQVWVGWDGLNYTHITLFSKV